MADKSERAVNVSRVLQYLIGAAVVAIVAMNLARGNSSNLEQPGTPPAVRLIRSPELILIPLAIIAVIVTVTALHQYRPIFYWYRVDE
jgi:hypothetical protein